MRSVINKVKALIKKHKRIVAFFAATMGMFLVYCTGTLVSNNGGSGTGVGNGMISGRVIYADSTPVKWSVVRLRTQSFLADTSGIPTCKCKRNDTLATVSTDSNGMFRIDSVDTGYTYFIEIDDERQQAEGTLYKVILSESDTMLHERVITPLKILTGKIIVSGMPKNAYVLIYGLDRVDKTDSTGTFEITDLPIGKCEDGECEYRLRILIPDGVGGAIQAIDTELEVEFDSLGNIKEVDLELGED